jgi:hypothetical protein
MTTVTLTNQTQLPLTVLSNTTVIIGSSFSITDITKFLIVGGSNIIIDGKFNTITISVASYPGFVLNNSISNTNIIIKNLSIVQSGSGSLALLAGAIGQTNLFNVSAFYCSSNIPINQNGGGIFGSVTTNCNTTNCFSLGSIDQYAGGIFGSYSLNCSATQCYSSGSIGQYAGGIFGFGTNYIWDGSNYAPTIIVDQSGNSITNTPNVNNNSMGLSGSTANSCYSSGSIGQYAGGIYGYFAYKSTASNCYSLGSSTSTSLLSGGIFAPTYYYDGSIYFPSNPLTTASYCYTIGSLLAGDGIFTQNALNTEYYCKGELNGIWKDCNAKYYLKGVGCVWIDISCSKSQPFLLKSFNRSLYSNPYQKVSCSHDSSSPGLFPPTYKIIRVNNKSSLCSISIDPNSGILSMKKLKKGKYCVKILNGIPTQVNLTYPYSYTIWTSYNISTYYIKSKYTKCKKSSKHKKKCKSSSSSSSSCSSSSSSSSSSCSYYKYKCKK